MENQKQNESQYNIIMSLPFFVLTLIIIKTVINYTKKKVRKTIIETIQQFKSNIQEKGQIIRKHIYKMHLFGHCIRVIALLTNQNANLKNEQKISMQSQKILQKVQQSTQLFIQLINQEIGKIRSMSYISIPPKFFSRSSVGNRLQKTEKKTLIRQGNFIFEELCILSKETNINSTYLNLQTPQSGLQSFFQIKKVIQLYSYSRIINSLRKIIDLLHQWQKIFEESEFIQICQETNLRDSDLKYRQDEPLLSSHNKRYIFDQLTDPITKSDSHGLTIQSEEIQTKIAARSQIVKHITQIIEKAKENMEANAQKKLAFKIEDIKAYTINQPIENSEPKLVNNPNNNSCPNIQQGNDYKEFLRQLDSQIWRGFLLKEEQKQNQECQLSEELKQIDQIVQLQQQC